MSDAEPSRVALTASDPNDHDWLMWRLSSTE